MEDRWWVFPTWGKLSWRGSYRPFQRIREKLVPMPCHSEDLLMQCFLFCLSCNELKTCLVSDLPRFCIIHRIFVLARRYSNGDRAWLYWLMIFYMFPPLTVAPIHLRVILGNQAFACKRGEMKHLVVIVFNCSSIGGGGLQTHVVDSPSNRPLPSWDPYTAYSPVYVEIPSPISDCWPPHHKSKLAIIVG